MAKESVEFMKDTLDSNWNRGNTENFKPVIIDIDAIIMDPASFSSDTAGGRSGEERNLLSNPSAFADGSTSVEAGLMELLQRMQTGRLKVFAHLADWFEEFRLYHRKDGRVVKQADDLMDATRYGIMCLRHARADERLLPPPPAAEGGAADSWMG